MIKEPEHRANGQRRTASLVCARQVYFFIHNYTPNRQPGQDQGLLQTGPGATFIEDLVVERPVATKAPASRHITNFPSDTAWIALDIAQKPPLTSG